MKKKTAFLLFLVLAIAACAPPLRVYYFPDARRYPPTSPAAVDLLRSEPRRPFEALAELRLDPPAGMSRFEVERLLRERAAAIGADALIIEVDNVYRERVWAVPARAMHAPRGRRARRAVVRERIIIAVAIRYH